MTSDKAQMKLQSILELIMLYTMYIGDDLVYNYPVQHSCIKIVLGVLLIVYRVFLYDL